ncbi:hypothetical protein FZS19_21715 [Salmonella enterica]|nr:hypothetical protein [Salmonella enterica]
MSMEIYVVCHDEDVGTTYYSDGSISFRQEDESRIIVGSDSDFIYYKDGSHSFIGERTPDELMADFEYYARHGYFDDPEVVEQKYPSVTLNSTTCFNNYTPKTELDKMVGDLIINPLDDNYGMPSYDEVKPYHKLLNNNPVLTGLFDWQIENTRTYCPELALAFSVASMASLISGRWSYKGTLTSNLYIAVLAPTSVGKTQTMDLFSKILQDSGDENRIGADNFKSEGGMSKEVAENAAKTFMLDELGFLIARIMSPKASQTDTQIQRAILKMFTAFNSGYSPEAKSANSDNNKNNSVIKNACPSIFGVSTPDVFWSAFSSREAGTGFLNRMVVIEAKTIGKRKEPKNSPMPINVGEFVSSIYMRFNTVESGRLFISNDCKTLIDGVNVNKLFQSVTKIEEDLILSDDKYGCVYARLAELTKRVAIVFQVTSNINSTHIEYDNAQAAYDFVRFCLDYSYSSAVNSIKDSNIERLQGEVIKAINEIKSDKSGNAQNYDGVTGKWIRERMLKRKSSINNDKESDAALMKMCRNGHIYRMEIKKDLGKQTYYYVKPEFLNEFEDVFKSHGYKLRNTINFE